MLPPPRSLRPRGEAAQHVTGTQSCKNQPLCKLSICQSPMQAQWYEALRTQPPGCPGPQPPQRTSPAHSPQERNSASPLVPLNLPHRGSASTVGLTPAGLWTQDRGQPATGVPGLSACAHRAAGPPGDRVLGSRAASSPWRRGGERRAALGWGREGRAGDAAQAPAPFLLLVPQTWRIALPAQGAHQLESRLSSSRRLLPGSSQNCLKMFP